MRVEEKWKTNIVIDLLLVAVLLLNFSGFKELHRTVELETQIEQLSSDLKAHKALYNEEIKYLDNQIHELEDQLNELIMLSYDYDYTVRVVAAESRGEPIEGQKAVAQTILERSLEWGMTPEQVVKEPGQYANPVSVNEVPLDTWKACRDVLLQQERIFVEPIKWFYNPSMGRSATHESKRLAGVIGNHAFYY